MAGVDLALDEWLGGEHGVVSLVFTDTVASTYFLFQRDTVNYLEIRRAQHRRVNEILESHPGRLIDRAGDGVFVAFHRVSDAWQFARQFFADAGHPEMHVRLGIHQGRVTAAGDELVGKAVHYAARVAHHGEGAEIWISEPAKTALEAEAADEAGAIEWVGSEECELRGVPGKQRLWRAA